MSNYYVQFACGKSQLRPQIVKLSRGFLAKGNNLRNVFIHGKQYLVLWFRKLRDRCRGPGGMKSYSSPSYAKFHGTGNIICSWHAAARFEIERRKLPGFHCFMEAGSSSGCYSFHILFHNLYRRSLLIISWIENILKCVLDTFPINTLNRFQPKNNIAWRWNTFTKTIFILNWSQMKTLPIGFCRNIEFSVIQCQWI